MSETCFCFVWIVVARKDLCDFSPPQTSALRRYGIAEITYSLGLCKYEQPISV